MSDEVKKTGLGHDDDGNVDDRRIAGWILIGSAVAMSIADLFSFMSANERIIETLLFGGALLMGSTVAEKFKRP